MNIRVEEKMDRKEMSVRVRREREVSVKARKKKGVSVKAIK